MVQVVVQFILSLAYGMCVYTQRPFKKKIWIFRKKVITADRYNCVLESYSFFRACTPEARRIMEEAEKERDQRKAMARRLARIHARRRKRKRGQD